MPPFRDLTGQTFNDLTAISREGTGSNGNIMWRFRCVCGEEIVHKGSTVSKGEKISCGCHKTRKQTTPRICAYCNGISTRMNQNGYVGNMCHECAAARMQKYMVENPSKAMVLAARGRAKKLGLPCTITDADVVIPEFCPILGVLLARGRIGDRENSPSLDRIVPSLGYVPGNIAVMSFRANRFKNDATAEELRKIATWMDANQPKLHLVA